MFGLGGQEQLSSDFSKKIWSCFLSFLHVGDFLSLNLFCKSNTISKSSVKNNNKKETWKTHCLHLLKRRIAPLIQSCKI